MKGIERARDRKRWERWRVTWGGGEKRERKLQAVGGEFKWNQVGSLPVCVCVAASYVCMEGGWLHVCVCVCVCVCESVCCCSVVELDTFGILEFGPQTRNFHLGGLDEGGGGGGSRGGGWPCRGGCMGVGMGCPSLLSSVFPSLAYIHSPAVRLHTHSIRLRREDRREDVPPLYWNKLKRDPPEEKKKKHCIQEHSKKKARPVSIARLWKKI